jgi:ribosomal protein S18 acetylase RimI-like enzyme
VHVEIVFRPAAVGDAHALASLVCLASQSHYKTTGFELSLGGTREHQHTEISRLAATKARSWFHFSHFEVAEADGRVVASAAGYDKTLAEKEIPIALREIGWTNQSLLALEQRLAELYSSFPSEPPATWTIDHVAVLPSVRRIGLARSLMERQFARGRAAGFHQCKLDVFEGNIRAIALYQNMEFQLSQTFGETALRKVLDRDSLLRMVRTI